MASRIYQLDYLKCIFIIFMVTFHLVYIGDKYPYAKHIVYTFHMPAFLVISGYLVNVQKDSKLFLLSVFWIFVPYAIMETGYTLMSALLPVREKVSGITFSFILNKIFIAPLGPYWYLHTLIICYMTYFVGYKICFRKTTVSFFILLGVCFWILSDRFKLLSMGNAFYFLIGILISQCRQHFTSIFQPSFWAILPFILLCCYPENLNRFSLAGVAITYLFISFTLWGYCHISYRMKKIMHFIGCNTLTILLFSPIFTMLSKLMIPLFAFDSTGMYFMCTAVTFSIAGSLFIAHCMDRLKLSRWFCGRTTMLDMIEEFPATNQ